MNDPFECLAIVERDISPEKIKEFKEKASRSTERRWQLMAQLRDEAIVDFMNSFRRGFIKDSYFFGSLSETNDNILLWSHYAASHTGFVLAIDFDVNNGQIHKVSYQDELPEFDNDWYFQTKPNDDTSSDAVSYLLKDLSIKSTNWSYEKEWRVSRKSRGYFRFKPEDVKALYYGLNCNTDIEKVIVMLLQYTSEDMPVYKMALSTKPLRMITKDYEFPDI